MGDMCKCKNQECPLKERCHRYTAKPDLYQFYGEFKYEDGKCEYFWDNNKKRKK